MDRVTYLPYRMMRDRVLQGIGRSLPKKVRKQGHESLLKDFMSKVFDPAACRYEDGGAECILN